MSELMRASREWASRPDDQRYLSLAELRAAVAARRTASRELRLTLDNVSVVPTEDGSDLLLTDGRTFDAGLTHYSFGQIASRAKLPAQALRDMPAELAALNLQWALEHKLDDNGEGRGAKLLITGDSAGYVTRAVTGPEYGRIWDLEVVDAVQRYIGDSNGAWKIPHATYASRDPLRASTLYASDRDVFLFLVNESQPVEVPGTDERLHRGFFAWNSETGAATFGLTMFYYRYVCDNRIVWGAQGVQELRIRHTSQGPGRFLREAAPQLRGYLNAASSRDADMVREAMRHELGKDKAAVVSFLRGRGFGAALAGQAYDQAERDGLNPRSLWGAVQGLTSEAHKLKHTDARIEREREAGALLGIVTGK